MANLDAQVVRPPTSDCYQEPHDHATAANACEGGHPAIREKLTVAASTKRLPTASRRGQARKNATTHFRLVALIA
jgi:hypothetical protein